MRVLQGNGVGAVQYDPRENPGAQFMVARRAWREAEMRPLRQAARAILSREAERRAGICEGILRGLVPMRVGYLKVLEGQNSSTRTIAGSGGLPAIPKLSYECSSGILRMLDYLAGRAKPN